MRKTVTITTALSLLALLAAAGDATAQPRRHRHVRYIYEVVHVVPAHQALPIERRSFLDPGVQKPVGSENYYAWMPAYEWGDARATYQRSWYMDENLHQAFDPRPISPLIVPPFIPY